MYYIKCWLQTKWGKNMRVAFEMLYVTKSVTYIY